MEQFERELERGKKEFLEMLKFNQDEAKNLKPLRIRYGFWRRLWEKYKDWRLRKEIESLRD